MTPRQRRFITEYMIDSNGAAAALRAGYRPSVAARAASGLLRHPEVAGAIAAALEEQALRRRATADRVVLEYARMAFADIRRYVDWGPDGVRLRPKSELTDWEAGAIREVQAGNADGTGGRIKLYDKNPALAALSRHTGLFDPNSSVGMADQSEAARASRERLRNRLLQIARGEE